LKSLVTIEPGSMTRVSLGKSALAKVCRELVYTERFQQQDRTYNFIVGIAELLANQLVLPFLGLVAASGCCNRVNERHVDELIRAEGAGL
jgi:hypothetical protein